MDELCKDISIRFAAMHIPDRYWSCGSLADDRICLIKQRAVWTVVYAERGEQKILHETHEAQLALDLFVEEVARIFKRVTRK